MILSDNELPDGYDAVLAEVSRAIREARAKAQLGVVSELACLHQRLANGTVSADELGLDGTVPFESDLDREMATDPYLLDFLGIAPLPPANDSRPSEHAIISTLEAYLLSLNAGFALAGSPYRLMTDEGAVLIDLLFFHVPTDRYVAILVANEGPMDLIVEEVRHIATMLDDTAKRILNDTIGIAILATEDGPIIRYSYLAAPDAVTKVAMPDEHHLTAVLSPAVHVQPM
jgi:predicted nuclease of restriction endonuclease-like (RecB) superfamily